MLSNQKLKQILVDPGYLKIKDFEQAVKEAKKDKKSLAEVLIAKNLVKEEYLHQLIAEYFGVPYINLQRKNIKPEIIKIIPELVAKKQAIIIFAKDKKGLHVAMNNPQDLASQHFIAKKSGHKVIPYYASLSDINRALKKYHGELKEEFSEIILKYLKQVKDNNDENLPIIKIVEAIIKYGYENRASDIHIEPYESDLIVRFRVDGVLHDVLVIPKDFYQAIIARIKIMANLRTDEHKSAQDGKIRFNLPEEKLDIRVSVVPIVEGEKIVMRLLAQKLRSFDLANLSFNEQAKNKVKNAIKSPWGMILATGPTGCGKTTTLYALLKEINNRAVNISTIEDPVEYDVEGVNQIQVDPDTNLTFAKGLRAILRQDPDIIMVGEIRDEETAKIALNSAMTGHLVLTTLHTNDAPSTLPRLLEMKAKDYLIASTVLLVIAQRLVRKICPDCIKSYTLTDKKFISLVGKDEGEKYLQKQKKIRLYKGSGCKLCHKTGYVERMGIYEVMAMSPEIRELITQKANSQKIKETAIKQGMKTMLEDGIDKALLGQTSLEEVLRVIKQ